MRNVQFTAISSGDASQTTLTSGPIDLTQVFCASVQVVAAGSPVGALKVQVSNDPCPAGNLAQNFVPTNWTDVSGLTVSISAAGTFLIPKFDTAYNFMHLVYTKTSGTGTITAEVNAKAY